MKLIVLYDTDNGSVLNSMNVDKDNYEKLIYDLPDGKKITKIDTTTKLPILDDTDEVKAKNKQLQEELDKKQYEIEKQKVELNKAQYDLLKQQSQIIDSVYMALGGE